MIPPSPRYSLLCRKNVRQYLLEVAQETGRTRFTRVSADSLAYLEERVAMIVRDMVHRQPSRGKTLTTKGVAQATLWNGETKLAP